MKLFERWQETATQSKNRRIHPMQRVQAGIARYSSNDLTDLLAPAFILDQQTLACQSSLQGINDFAKARGRSTRLRESSHAEIGATTVFKHDV